MRAATALRPASAPALALALALALVVGCASGGPIGTAPPGGVEPPAGETAAGRAPADPGEAGVQTPIGPPDTPVEETASDAPELPEEVLPEEEPEGEGGEEGEGEEGEGEEGEGGELSNAIRWSTASEVENFGFDVYRATSEDGPFERITEKPVEGAGTTDVPQYYEYVDDEIEPGQEYWYWVESISVHGEREAFTPVVRVGPKGE